jgi:tetratricopeptide (TPR) repeat protein
LIGFFARKLLDRYRAGHADGAIERTIILRIYSGLCVAVLPFKVTASDMDAASGVQPWAETYNRELGDGAALETLDDVTDRIVATVAGGHSVIARSVATATREKPLEEAAHRNWYRRGSHTSCNSKLSMPGSVRPSSGYPTANPTMHLNCREYVHRLNPLEKPMERALEAAWRVVTIDPACQLGWQQLAEAHFFARDYTAFTDAAERAMALNPRNSHTRAYLGLLIAFSGEWDRGMALVQRAMALNPHLPGW